MHIDKPTRRLLHSLKRTERTQLIEFISDGNKIVSTSWTKHGCRIVRMISRTGQRFGTLL